MKTNRRAFWLIVGLTFLAAILRLADLTGRSFWLDESYTLDRIAGSWLDVLNNVVYVQGGYTVDAHPPVYFLLLKAWTYIAGDSEFALRLVSALGGVVIVPLMYALGRRLFSQRAGFIAACFALLNPAFQGYSHELRMYSLVICLAALSAYLLYRGVQSRRPGLFLLAWFDVVVIALLAHYSFIALLTMQMVFMAISAYRWLPRLRIRHFVALFCCLAAIIVLCVLALRITQLSSFVAIEMISGAAPLPDVFRYVIDASLFGLNATDPTGGWIIWSAGVMWLLGAVLPSGRGRTRQNWLARLFLIVSFAGTAAVVTAMLAISRRWVDFRYYLVAVPAFYVLIARALDVMWARGAALLRRYGDSRQRTHYMRRVAGLAVAGVATLSLASIALAQGFGSVLTFVRTDNWQDDWRALAQVVAYNWQEGDALVVGPLTPDAALKLYLRDVPVDVIWLSQIQNSTMHTVASKYRRVWYAISGRGYNESFKAEFDTRFHARKRYGFPAHSDTIELTLYDVRSPVSDGLPAGVTAVSVSSESEMTQAVRIAGYTINPGNPYNPQPNIRLSVYWERQPNSTVDPGTVVSFKLKTADGAVWVDWLMPADLEPTPGTWIPGALLRIDYVVPVPLGLPPQDYSLELITHSGAKSEVEGRAVSSLDRTQLDCCVRIKAWHGSPTSGRVARWITADVMLLDAEYPASIEPGQILPVMLTWQLRAGATSDWQTFVSLDGFLGGNIVTSGGESGIDQLQVTAWPIDEPVRAMKSLVLPQALRAGWYRLALTRKSSDGRVMDSTLLGLVEVKDFPLSPVANEIPHRVNATVGEFSMLGYGLYQPPTRTVLLEFHTYWRADTTPTRDGVIFLHLMGPDTQTAQDDNPPEQGRRSTLSYRPGEGIDQIHRIIIPVDWPGGKYRLYAGIYDRASLDRWMVKQDGQPARDNLVYLGTIDLADLQDLPGIKTFLPMIVHGAD
ncbi:MAG: glycosyltransferase family 39 protein [Chloroflexi bacterium]|nr:glycosyltransferase family 39 protein [Chloroflexota bacterium]